MRVGELRHAANLSRRRKHPQPMSVRIHRDERAAEVEVGRRLDHEVNPLPRGVRAVDGVGRRR